MKRSNIRDGIRSVKMNQSLHRISHINGSPLTWIKHVTSGSALSLKGMKN